MGAITALRGYRTQFLYSLNKVLSEYDKGYIYKPEGFYEDLDIIDSKGKYIEVIQVKNQNSVLTFSDLFTSKDSFFKRAIKLLKENEKAIIKLVSFGGVSDELINKDKLIKKLRKKKFIEADINKIVNNYQIPEVLDETELENEILNKLNEIRPFIDSKVALELLLYTFYISGEKQYEISGLKLISDLDKIGVFINEQISFINQFGNSIIPLRVKSLTNEVKSKLKNEFYYGVSARYEHILSDLDIIREEKLLTIEEAFRDKNIVFIHGASGQGKSTLAYRFLHDYLDSNTIYELKVSQKFSEVLETITTLNALCKGLTFPVTLYIDIKPGDIYWNEILKELSTKRNLQFLVTLRQEDWNRTTLGVDFDFQDIELNFDKKEAEVVYNSLSDYRVDLKFTSFKESWLEFGNGGLLLEYIYLINQGSKLKKRLENQIIRLENEQRVEELEILRFVCLSDLFSSKINYLKITQLIDIKGGLSNSFIKLLEKEYLLKYSENKEYLTGLHPIRSKLLCEILFDENNYVNVNDYIEKSVSLVDEEDLHLFLLNSLNKGFTTENLLNTLKKLEITTWDGYRNIFNALLWKGAHDFTLITNRAVFSEAYELLKDSWWIFVFVDFSELRMRTDQYDLIKILEKNEDSQSERIKQIENLNKRLSQKEEVFNFCNLWLENLDKKEIRIIPKNNFEWNSCGEFLFWIGHLKKEIKFLIDDEAIQNFFNNNPGDIKIQSNVLLGLNSINFLEVGS